MTTLVSHTFLFADLAGYTALTEAHGDEAAADAAAGFCDRARALLPGHGAHEVKAIGDALMIHVPEALGAARLAEELVCGYGRSHRELGVGVGMHTGTAVRRGGDWFGSAVNIAARVADLACAGEVLLTAATVAALGPSVGMRSRGTHALKNVTEPVELFELALGDSRSPRALPVDPVCRMAIDPERAVERRAHDGAEYLFCSQRCAGLFAGAPDRYAARARGAGHAT